jgi:hypothetical protein
MTRCDPLKDSSLASAWEDEKDGRAGFKQAGGGWGCSELGVWDLRN